MNALVSVIVAAYNAEAYLRQCLEGILNQTFRNYEVLLVDDGSTDATASICDEYAKRDERIRVLHEQHQGVTISRQVAFSHAHGKYLLRIDADDQTAPMMLEEMVQTIEATDADLLICDYLELLAEGTTYKQQCPSALTPAAIANDLLECRLFGALWNKLIKSSCVKDNAIRLHEDLDLREDIVFLLDLLPSIGKIAYLPRAFYTYDRKANANSLSNTYLQETRHYYDQEILWYKAALDCPLIYNENRQRFESSLLNYAYITLSGKFFSISEWMAMFKPYMETFRKTDKSYKRGMVIWALEGHFSTASLLRRMIAHFRGKT